jgi:probable DNA metabolism protein
MPRTPEEQDAWEFHRWQGFTRFRPAPDGSLLARIAPSCDILEGLAGYFSRRLRGRKWTMIDEARGKAAVSGVDGKWRIVPWKKGADNASAPDEIETLWQTYFETIEIRERHNPRLQKQHVPSRYRPYLPEFKPPR